MPNAFGFASLTANARAFHTVILQRLEPLEAALSGFPPSQPSLLDVLQNWLNEIG